MTIAPFSTKSSRSSEPSDRGSGELKFTLADQPALSIHAAVVQAVDAFRAAAPQRDDITLVIVKAL